MYGTPIFHLKQCQSTYSVLYNVLFLTSFKKYLACPLNSKSYSSFIASMDFGYLVYENRFPEGKKNHLLLLFIALLESLVFESAQTILCYYETGRDYRFTHVSSKIFRFPLFFFNTNTFSTLLPCPLRLTRSL